MQLEDAAALHVKPTCLPPGVAHTSELHLVPLNGRPNLLLVEQGLEHGDGVRRLGSRLGVLGVGDVDSQQVLPLGIKLEGVPAGIRRAQLKDLLPGGGEGMQFYRSITLKEFMRPFTTVVVSSVSLDSLIAIISCENVMGFSL